MDLVSFCVGCCRRWVLTSASPIHIYKFWEAEFLNTLFIFQTTIVAISYFFSHVFLTDLQGKSKIFHFYVSRQEGLNGRLACLEIPLISWVLGIKICASGGTKAEQICKLTTQ